MKNALCLACALATASLPQEVPSFRSNVEIAVVSCSVVDASGAAVDDLTRDEFQVYDNDVRRPIKNLWIDSAMTLGVILDASESQSEQLSEHRRTAEELLERVMRSGDRAFVIYAGEKIRLWADLTNTAAVIRRRLSEDPGDLFGEPCATPDSHIPGLGPTSACGPSPLWDAIYHAAQLKLRSLTGNKAVLILTDGFDTGSSHTWSQAADAAARAGASVYAIQYKGEFGGSFAPDLYRLIGAAGGTWFKPPSGDYRRIISRLEADLRRRYVIGFTPEKLSGKIRHDLRIEVTRPGLTVRGPRTYFQEPQ